MLRELSAVTRILPVHTGPEEILFWWDSKVRDGGQNPVLCVKMTSKYEIPSSCQYLSATTKQYRHQKKEWKVTLILHCIGVAHKCVQLKHYILKVISSSMHVPAWCELIKG